ncbi:MAG: tryptophan-rich sensory protein [Candidatus Dojkabacteria bacterium]
MSITKLAERVVFILDPTINAIVSYVWIFLMTLMIVSGVLLYQQRGDSVSFEVMLILLLLILTIAYPLYSFGFQPVPGLIGTILYGGFLVFILFRVFQVNSLSALLLLPVLIWVLIATLNLSSLIIVERS